MRGSEFEVLKQTTEDEARQAFTKVLEGVRDKSLPEMNQVWPALVRIMAGAPESFKKTAGDTHPGEVVGFGMGLTAFTIWQRLEDLIELGGEEEEAARYLMFLLSAADAEPLAAAIENYLDIIISVDGESDEDDEFDSVAFPLINDYGSLTVIGDELEDLWRQGGREEADIQYIRLGAIITIIALREMQINEQTNGLLKDD